MSLKDFTTYLWPAVKAGNVGFYKKPDAANPTGSKIDAAFTRANTPEDGTKGGTVRIGTDGNFEEINTANEPRWTAPIGGTNAGAYKCPYLSFLPSVENEQRYSSDLTKGVYAKSGNGAATSSAIASPLDAVNYTEIYNNGGGVARVRFDSTAASSATKLISFWCRKKDESNLLVSDSGAGTSVLNVNFNFDTGDFDAQGGTAYIDSGVVDFGNGDYFIWIEFDLTTATAPTFFLDSYTSGNGTYVTGVLFKEGSYISPLDYVPTTNLALTRQQDLKANVNLVSDGYFSSKSVGSIALQLGFNGFGTITTSRFSWQESGVAGRFTFRENVGGLLFFDLVNSAYATIGGATNFIPEGELVKFVINFSSTELELWYNGFLIYSASGDFSIDAKAGNGPNAMEWLWKQEAYTSINLTPSEAIAASSWATLEEMATDLNYEIE